MTTMPPQILGLNDQARALRLALAVFDDDRGRYDAAIADALSNQRVSKAMDTLIYALVRNWVQTLVEHRGCERARVRVERELAGIAEHYDELTGGTHSASTPGDEPNEGDVW
jgi:hypothetical protein